MPITPPMSHSNDLTNLVESFEGVRLESYQDVGGVWTIGYGHTAGVVEGQTETLSGAMFDLNDDIDIADAAVNRLVNVPLGQDEFDALSDFVFNAGEGNFAGSTMLRLLNSGDYQAAANQFDLWDHVSGKVVAGLLRRRQDETAMFEKDIPTNG